MEKKNYPRIITKYSSTSTLVSDYTAWMCKLILALLTAVHYRFRYVGVSKFLFFFFLHENMLWYSGYSLEVPY